MKKALLTLAAALTASVYGATVTDGDINFSNIVIPSTAGGTYSPGIFNVGVTPINADGVNGSPGGAGARAGGITVGLFRIGSTTPLISAPLYTTAEGAGFEWGINSGADVTLVGNAPGTTVQLQVKAWETGKTWETSTIRSDAAAGIFTSLQLGGPNPSPGSAPFFTPALTGLQSFALVPEPSTYALGIAGLGALAMMRRRK